MEWLMAFYGYKAIEDMKRRNRKPIPEEMEYVEMLRA
jgi:hypothetical protein